MRLTRSEERLESRTGVRPDTAVMNPKEYIGQLQNIQSFFGMEGSTETNTVSVGAQGLGMCP